MDLVAKPARGPVRGALRVPGDKSISHRAVLFAAIAEGTSHLSAVLDSADIRSTIDAVSALGAGVTVADGPDGLEITVAGWGSRAPSEPTAPVDCGNSGTTARLLLGVLAGWPLQVTLTGDESLSRRPMGRVTEPLSRMGASFETEVGGTLPVTVRGSEGLRPVEHDMPVASAQVKTALLLAALRAEGRSFITEPAPSRDHTERLLPAFGVPVGREGLAAWVDGPDVPTAARIAVPADPSSAAFMHGAALMTPGGEVTVRRMSVNPTRTGYLRVLERMGARIEEASPAEEGAEPSADVTVSRWVALSATHVHAPEVPSLIDELPLLAVVATQAHGRTVFEGIEELRVKESDRLAAVTEALRMLGASVHSGDDWLEVSGPAALKGGVKLDPLGDHRLAMAYAVAALAADAPVTIRGFEAVHVSYPSFAADLRGLLD